MLINLHIQISHIDPILLYGQQLIDLLPFIRLWLVLSHQSTMKLQTLKARMICFSGYSYNERISGSRSGLQMSISYAPALWNFVRVFFHHYDSYIIGPSAFSLRFLSFFFLHWQYYGFRSRVKCIFRGTFLMKLSC